MSSDVSLAEIESGEASPEEVAAYNEQVERELSERVEQRREARSAEQQQALDALRGDDPDDTAEVELGNVTLTVRTYLDEASERVLEKVQQNRDDADLQRKLLPELMAWSIVDAESDAVDDASAFMDASFWREFLRERGRGDLMLKWARVQEPRLDRAENDEVVRRFRNRREG